jgi:hypothetical protein
MPPPAELVLSPKRTSSDPGSLQLRSGNIIPTPVYTYFSDDAELPIPVREVPRPRTPVDPSDKLAACAAFLQRSPSSDLSHLLDETREFPSRVDKETTALKIVFLGQEADRRTAPGDFQLFVNAVNTIPTAWATLYVELSTKIRQTNPAIKNALLQLDQDTTEFGDAISQAVQFNSRWLDIITTGHAKRSVPYADTQSQAIQTLTGSIAIITDKRGVTLSQHIVELQQVIARLS